MSCFNPLTAYRIKDSDGSWRYSFRDFKGNGLMVEYPCGACMGCIRAHRQSWSMRITHEARYHPVSAFLTLTYDEAHCPSGEIPYAHFSTFLRALRDSLSDSVRYFVAAEYGARTGRPHFHAVIFGYYPSDAVPISSGASQLPLFASSSLLALWGKGHVSVAPFSPATASYVAGYVTKKVMISGVGSRDITRAATGRRFVLDARHQSFTPVNDLPEYHHSSRRPGLGHQWIQEFHADVLRDGYVIFNGNRCAIPRYYRKVLAKHWPDRYQALVDRREEFFSLPDPDSSLDRLIVREKVALAQSKASFGRTL